MISPTFIGQLKNIGLHYGAILYTFLFSVICIGVHHYTGFTYFGPLAFFYVSFLISYLFLAIKLPFAVNIQQWFLRFQLNPSTQERIIQGLMWFSFLFVPLHWYILGGIPTIRGFLSNNSFEIYEIRKNITNVPTLFNYLYSFEIKAILPFCLLYLYKTGNKFFWLFLLFSTCYGLSLIMKSPILTILLPLGISSLLDKKFWLGLGLAGIIGIGTVLLSFCSNPVLRGGDTFQATSGIVDETPKTFQESTKKSVAGLQNRIIYVPGKTVAFWFVCVPDSMPFLEGRGNKIIAGLKGETFVDYSTELYRYIYPGYYRRGYQGRVNCASFMYDYANFGTKGMVFSGIFLSIVFYLVFLFTRFNPRLSLPINLSSCLMISSTSLTTLLLTGGWGILVLLGLFTSKLFHEKS